jgi:hypothetical protein
MLNLKNEEIKRKLEKIEDENNIRKMLADVDIL